METLRITEADELVRIPDFGDEVYIADLREVAYAWHGGQWSPLYAFASSGHVVAGLRREALQCAEHASPDTEPTLPALYDDETMLRAIAALEPVGE